MYMLSLPLLTSSFVIMLLIDIQITDSALFDCYVIESYSTGFMFTLTAH